MRRKTGRYLGRLGRHGIAVSAGLVLLLAAAGAASASLEAARSLAAQGDPAAALRLVEQQLSAEPDLPDGLFLKGVLLVELRRADEAHAIFERLIELQPGLPEPYNNLAVIQAAAGDYETAVATLRRSLQTHASYRTAYENLTKIYSQLASEAYAEALEPGTDERPEVVELVLLGNLGEFVGVRSDAGDEPTAETQIAAAEPTAMAQTPPLPAPEAAQEPEMAEPEMPKPEVTEPEMAEPEMPKPEVTEPAIAEPEMTEPEAAEAEATSIGETPFEATAESVAPFVEGWRSAWQEQRVDDYLAAYAADFRPGDGSTWQQWSEVRRERLSAPEFIRVTLAYLDEPHVEGSTAQIRFLQSYESNTFQDRVTKMLTLTWEDGGWKILEEQAE